MDWSPLQQRAIDAVASWFRERSEQQQIFRLFGYAGSGKTTLARSCAASLGRHVIFAAFTGKAALVLRQKGCVNARTIHSLIYQPRDKSGARLQELKALYTELLKKNPPPEELARHEAKCREVASEISKEQSGLKQPAFALNVESEVRYCDLIVIDEVSMVGHQMGHDLCFFEKPILVLGDPAQLPPVADGGYFTSDRPDIMLEEVHRQAEDSPIIQLATTVRRGGRLTLGTYGASSVVARGTIGIDQVRAEYDQVLCGRNATRREINLRFRRSLGRSSPWPEEGDRLVCLRNNHELGLLNGSMWVTVGCREMDEHLALTLRPEDGGCELGVVAHKKTFLGEPLDFFERRDAEEFDYGYALTVHKAQGSQWRSVFIVDESGTFREHANRWLYTALTRAAEKVTVAV